MSPTQHPLFPFVSLFFNKTGPKILRAHCILCGEKKEQSPIYNPPEYSRAQSVVPRCFTSKTTLPSNALAIPQASAFFYIILPHPQSAIPLINCSAKSTGHPATSAHVHKKSAPSADKPFTPIYPPFIAAKVYGAETGGRPLTASLSGAEEVPGPGDADGFGGALITLNQGQGMVCWELSVSGIDTPTAAHIHQGELGVSSSVVVTLSAPEDGSSFGCASVDAELIKEIRQDPAGFYVNVHNSEFPVGALRGQLGK